MFLCWQAIPLMQEHRGDAAGTSEYWQDSEEGKSVRD